MKTSILDVRIFEAVVNAYLQAHIKDFIFDSTIGETWLDGQITLELQFKAIEAIGTCALYDRVGLEGIDIRFAISVHLAYDAYKGFAFEITAKIN